MTEEQLEEQMKAAIAEHYYAKFPHLREFNITEGDQ